MNSVKKIGIYSCCVDEWGGSEELWARAVPFLQKDGMTITLIKQKINESRPEIKKLTDSGVQLFETDPATSLNQKRIRRITKRLQRKLSPKSPWYPIALENFSIFLETGHPHLMIIAQGINFDGLKYAKECIRHQIPYVLIVQKAVDFFWPQPHERDDMLNCYRQAKAIFFVSQHNKRLTEEQFGARLENSVLISNPIKVSKRPLSFPNTTDGFKLACVGRLFVLDKGQDMLLRLLSEQRWRQRPVDVSIVGTGVDETGLKEMATLLELKNVHFSGQVSNIEQLWLEHHALVLPSRGEGLALSVLEAMAAGRPVIVTDAGGNAEIVTEGETGFIGEYCQQSFSNTMERAWNARNNWEEIGSRASAYISNNLPPYPEKRFAEIIKQIINE